MDQSGQMNWKCLGDITNVFKDVVQSRMFQYIALMLCALVLSTTCYCLLSSAFSLISCKLEDMYCTCKSKQLRIMNSSSSHSRVFIPSTSRKETNSYPLIYLHKNKSIKPNVSVAQCPRTSHCGLRIDDETVDFRRTFDDRLRVESRYELRVPYPGSDRPNDVAHARNRINEGIKKFPRFSIGNFISKLSKSGMSARKDSPRTGTGCYYSSWGGKYCPSSGESSSES